MKEFQSSYWRQISLSPSGRPILEPNEYDILMVNDVGVYQDSYKVEDLQKGRIYLTNKRLVFVNDIKKNLNLAIQLKEIQDIDLYNGFLKSSPKITLNLSNQSEVNINSAKEVQNSPKKQKKNISWACPICSYSNSSSVLLESIETDLPICNNCGIQSHYDQIEKIIKEESKTNGNTDFDLVSFDASICPSCTFVNHPSMLECEICGTKLTNNSFLIHPYDKSEDTAKVKLKTTESYESIDLSIIKLSFRKGGHRLLYDKISDIVHSYLAKKSIKKNDQNDKLHKTLKKEKESYINVDGNNKVVSLSNGIHGLTNKSVEQSHELSSLLEQSVQDLDQLMSMAKKIIAMSSKYQKVLADKNKTTLAYDRNNQLLQNSRNSVVKIGQLLNNKQIEKSIRRNKMTNALNSLKKEKSEQTKSKFSLVYINELSRDICDFLTDENILDKKKGLITLYELLFLYNKSRQINLISAEELYDAVSQFDKLNLNMKCEKIEVLQLGGKDIGDSSNTKSIYVVSKSNNDVSVKTKIFNYIISNPGLSALQLQNEEFDINFLILETILNNFVNEGQLLIDKNNFGYTYWPNKIIVDESEVTVESNLMPTENAKAIQPNTVDISNFKMFSTSENDHSERYKELDGLLF